MPHQHRHPHPHLHLPQHRHRWQKRGLALSLPLVPAAPLNPELPGAYLPQLPSAGLQMSRRGSCRWGLEEAWETCLLQPKFKITPGTNKDWIGTLPSHCSHMIEFAESI